MDGNNLYYKIKQKEERKKIYNRLGGLCYKCSEKLIMKLFVTDRCYSGIKNIYHYRHFCQDIEIVKQKIFSLYQKEKDGTNGSQVYLVAD